MILSRFIKFLIILLITFPCFAQERIVNLEEDSVSVVDNELRKLRKDIDDINLATYDQNVIIHAKSDTEIDVDAIRISIEGQIETSLDITINGATTGVNAMDVGSLGASTWYYVWVIYDTATSTTAGLVSASSTDPTMPTDYTSKRLIGYALTDADSDLLKSYQFMNEFMWDIPVSMTTTVKADWFTLDCSAAILSGVRMGIFGLASAHGSAACGIAIRPNGSTWTVDNAGGIHGYHTVSGQRECMTDGSQNIEYYNNAGDTATTIMVEGFICGLF